MKRLAVVVLLGGLLGSCGGGSHATPSKPKTTTATGVCVARGLLPDPTCTPGATNPAVTQATIASTICVKGWTATVRPPVSVTTQIKIEREIAYGIPGPHPRPFGGAQGEELDHLIPLELGGAPADVKNLWPEAAPGYPQKDLTENRLRQEVCAGTLKLADAQHEIATDWQNAP